jgi:predicted HAD superfamily phosphohydrolase
MLGGGTGIHLTPDEERTIAPISEVAYAALALTNDLFSWEKELKSHLESKGQVPLVNAVHVVMASNNVTERTAKAVVRKKSEHTKNSFPCCGSNIWLLQTVTVCHQLASIATGYNGWKYGLESQDPSLFQNHPKSVQGSFQSQYKRCYFHTGPPYWAHNLRHLRQILIQARATLGTTSIS